MGIKTGVELCEFDSDKLSKLQCTQKMAILRELTKYDKLGTDKLHKILNFDFENILSY